MPGVAFNTSTARAWVSRVQAGAGIAAFRRQHLHRELGGQARSASLRGAVGDQRGAQRQRRQERHHRDHEIQRRGALVARQDVALLVHS